MAERAFDRDTLIDLSVNIIPLGILTFFIVLYTVYQPFGWEFGSTVLMYGLTIVPFVVLAVVTYISGRAVYRDEQAATKTATEHDVGEQPRTHRQTGDTTDAETNEDTEEGAVGVNRETTPAEATGDAEGTTDERADETGDPAGESETRTDENGNTTSDE